MICTWIYVCKQIFSKTYDLIPYTYFSDRKRENCESNLVSTYRYGRDEQVFKHIPTCHCTAMTLSNAGATLGRPIGFV